LTDRSLRRRAARIRADVLRLAHAAGAPGIGSALSIVDALTVLYGGVLRLGGEGDASPGDVLILGKGHAALALYATLAEYGHLPRPTLLSYGRDGADLTTAVNHAVAGVAVTVVTDGIGLGIAVGLARADRSRRVFVILGDAECDRGAPIAAAVSAARDGLDNVVVFVDRNGFHGPCRAVAEPDVRGVADRWRSHGWEAREIDGHAYPQLVRGFDRLPARPGLPTVVVGATIKGAGVSFMENDPLPARFVAADIGPEAILEACGLASAGKIVFVFGPALPAALRSMTVLRSVAVPHQLDVKLIGANAGLADLSLPGAGHAIDDVGLARAIPELSVLAPGDPAESAALTAALVRHRGPAYMRLAAGDAQPIHGSDLELSIGDAVTVRDGDDLTLIAAGAALVPTWRAARALESVGLDARVVSMPTIAPIDRAAVESSAGQARVVVTVEEHSIVGGLGSAVAEVMAGLPAVAPLIRLGLPHRLPRAAGSRRHLLEHHRLTAVGIVDQIASILGEPLGRPSPSPGAPTEGRE